MIIMLNLLISIISETYAEVKDDAVSNTYKEMASLIAENFRCISPIIEESCCDLSDLSSQGFNMQNTVPSFDFVENEITFNPANAA